MRSTTPLKGIRGGPNVTGCMVNYAKIERQGAMFGWLLNMMRDQLSRMYLSAWSQPSTHIHDRCLIQIQRQSVPTCYPTLCLNGPFHHLATLPSRSVMQRPLSRLNRRPARLFGFAGENQTLRLHFAGRLLLLISTPYTEPKPPPSCE